MNGVACDSVIRRLLGLGDDDAPAADADSSPARTARGARDAPSRHTAASNGSSNRKNKGRATPALRSTSPRGRQTAAKHGARAPRGSLMRHEEYELPILQALAERGGRAAKSEIIDALEPVLAGQLTELDRTTLESGEVRWRNRAQFARLRLVQRGDMVKASPRGIWELAQPGSARLADAGVTVNGAGAR